MTSKWKGIEMTSHSVAATAILSSATERVTAVTHSIFSWAVAGLLVASAPAHAQCPVSFAAAVNYPVGAGAWNPRSVAIGDLNGDGTPDLAVANGSGNTTGSVSVMLGTGSGTFGLATNFTAGNGPNSVAIADFDGDGRPDLAVTNGAGPSHSISIFLNTGTVGGPASFALYGTWGSGGWFPRSLVIHDFNGDDKLDLAVANAGSSWIDRSNVAVFLNTSTGAGNVSFAVTTYVVGTSPGSVAGGYLNDDPWLDLAITRGGGSPSVSILLGTGTGIFVGDGTIYPVSSGAVSVAIGDLNGDGKSDLAVPSAQLNVSILLGNGDGTFGAATGFPAGALAWSVAIGDLNGDGMPDLAVTNSWIDSVSILLGTGTGVFGAPMYFTAGDFPVFVALRDFDGDGKPDLAVANNNSNNVSILLNTSPCSPDAPPTAVAGPDQSIRAQGIVTIDGTASFDDNTPSESLAYAWSFVSVPPGSAASFTNPAAAMTSFTADLAGSYVAQLVVYDSLGQPSLPSQVVISSTNLAPTANAGPDQVAIVGNVVTMSGAASSDPEMDPLTYQWTLMEAPVGSSAGIVGDQDIACLFQPDLPGSYILALVVDDGLGPSVADTVLVTAITGQQFAENILMLAMAAAAALPPAAVTTTGNQNAFGNFLSQAIRDLQSNDLSGARHKLHMAIERADGCTLRGTPDASGSGRDWLIDCPSQIDIYNLLVAALNAISP